MNDILYLFHHIHHDFHCSEDERHCVHHCGGGHREIDPLLDYVIEHCQCEKHSIDKEFAVGHTTNGKLELEQVKIIFTEKCPHGGWHIESGVLV